MKKIFAVLSIALCCIIFTACNSNQKKDKDAIPDIKKTVEDNPGANKGAGTYSISGPAGWEKLDTIISGAKVTTLKSPPDGPGD